MKLNWIIGVEGSGHHLLRAVAKKHLALPTTVDKGDYYPLLEQRWRPGESRLPRVVVKSELSRIIENYRRMGVEHLYEDTSFPFGPSRTALTRPDIVDLVDLFEGVCDVSVVLLYRDPVETTFSAFRRGFGGTIAAECLVTEANHQHICSQLSTTGPSIRRTLEFDRLLRNPNSCLQALSDWMGIDAVNLDPAGCDPGRPVKVRDMPEVCRSYLKDFFDERRTAQWSGFYSSRPLIE